MVRRHSYGYKNRTKRIIGISLGVIGLLIIINIMSMRFLLLLIGLCLLLMGALLCMK